MGRHDESKSLSIRRSIVVWVVGAVLLWGLAVAVLYSAVRYIGESQEVPSNKTDPPAVTVKDRQTDIPAVGSKKDETSSKEDTASAP